MDDNKRSAKFKKNARLESHLQELNGLLSDVENKLIDKASSKLQHPLILIMGVARSGTTLLMQYLAQSTNIAYPTNFLSRFYSAPYVGVRIQQLFTDFDALNEFPEFNINQAFQSNLGKTSGTLSPNEFWYFWRRFAQKNPSELIKSEMDFDFKNFQREISLMISAFNKPLAMKGMIANYIIKELCENLENVIFIHLHRDLSYNVNSLLNARMKYFNNIEEWYSFPPGDEFYDYPRENVFEEVAAQVCSINNTVQKSLNTLPNKNQISIKYSDFCDQPFMLHEALKEKLGQQGYDYNYKADRAQYFDSRTKLNPEWEEAIGKVSEKYRKMGLDRCS